MRRLYLAWQDAASRRWFPIGCLTEQEERYRFVYTRGVMEAQQESGFQLFPTFPKIDTVYTSDVLFPLFRNRVMPQSRPDYPNYVQWLQLGGRDKDPIAFLGNSGGRKVTDTLEVFPAATLQEDGAYSVVFFAHGVRHMTPESIERAGRLEIDEPLRMLLDVQNPHDRNAIALATCKADVSDLSVVGYCPRYLANDTRRALDENAMSCQVRVVVVNLPPAPLQFRVLCRMDILPESKVVPFQGDEFRPIVE